jgi:hypothetical protein
MLLVTWRPRAGTRIRFRTSSGNVREDAGRVDLCARATRQPAVKAALIDLLKGHPSKSSRARSTYQRSATSSSLCWPQKRAIKRMHPLSSQGNSSRPGAMISCCGPLAVRTVHPRLSIHRSAQRPCDDCGAETQTIMPPQVAGLQSALLHYRSFRSALFRWLSKQPFKNSGESLRADELGLAWQ